MNREIKPSRPGNWAERTWRRVAFFAHALLPDCLSTTLISRRLEEVGVQWSEEGAVPDYFRWLQFPVVPKYGNAQPVWVDFYLVPLLAPAFLAASRDGRAFKWVEEMALAAISEAKHDGVDIWLGWGAMTKVATGHGQLFIDQHPEVLNDSHVHSTHGDAGTAALVLEALREIGIHKRAFRIAVIGANGAIGEAVSRMLPQLNPESILLVGKADRPGENKNFTRLNHLKSRVEANCRAGQSTKVEAYQNTGAKELDGVCYDYDIDVVIVATTGMDLSPLAIPEGTLVVDMTTPSACHPDPGWQGRLVVATGCGVFNPWILPSSFGDIAGIRCIDAGSGGPRTIWGCAGETIARATFNWCDHLRGVDIPLDAIKWADDHFRLMGFKTQPAVSFGRFLSWQYVRGFISNTADRKKRARRITLTK